MTDPSGRRRSVYRVAGQSMHPVLRDGDEIEVDEDVLRDRAPVPGELVLVRHPFKSGVVMVKRVLRIETDGRLFVVGEDTTESSDSRGFGALAPALVVGLVIGPVRAPES